MRYSARIGIAIVNSDGEVLDDSLRAGLDDVNATEEQLLALGRDVERLLANVRRARDLELILSDPALIAEARGWLSDNVWADDPKIAEYEPRAIARAVARLYEGGIQAFVAASAGV